MSMRMVEPSEARPRDAAGMIRTGATFDDACEDYLRWLEDVRQRNGDLCSLLLRRRHERHWEEQLLAVVHAIERVEALGRAAGDQERTVLVKIS